METPNIKQITRNSVFVEEWAVGWGGGVGVEAQFSNLPHTRLTLKTSLKGTLGFYGTWLEHFCSKLLLS